MRSVQARFHLSFVICHFPDIKGKCSISNEKWKMENDPTYANLLRSDLATAADSRFRSREEEGQICGERLSAYCSH
jgi:hypothetical protein